MNRSDLYEKYLDEWDDIPDDEFVELFHDEIRDEFSNSVSNGVLDDDLLDEAESDAPLPGTRKAIRQLWIDSIRAVRDDQRLKENWIEEKIEEENDHPSGGDGEDD